MNPPTTNLTPGMSGQAVLQLQQYLLSRGLLTQADINTGPGIYGPKTTAAVQKLQQQLGVDNSSGAGYWGPRTIAAINGNSNNAAPTSTANGSTDTQPHPLTAIQALANTDPFIAEMMNDPSQKAALESLSGQPALLQSFLQQAKSLKAAIEGGKVINPSIDINDPAVIKRFTDQATSLLDPYYKEQMGFLQKDLDTSLGRLKDDYEKSIGRSQDVFKQTLETNSENAAQTGTTYSSGRNDKEKRTVNLQQNALDDALTTATRSGQDAVTNAERKTGSSALSSMNLPGFSQYSADNTGTYAPLGTRTLSLAGGITGTLPNEEKANIDTKSRTLMADELNRGYISSAPYV